MNIDIEDLLRSVAALQTPGARIGLPDDPTPVDIAEPHNFGRCLDNALRAFRDLRGADYLALALGWILDTGRSGTPPTDEE